MNRSNVSRIIGATPPGIPFLRVMPDQEVVVQPIVRPAAVTILADSFIIRGGRYVLALLPNNEVCLGAMIEGLDGEPFELCRETTLNGVMLPFAVDRLVRESFRLLASVH